MAGLVTVICVWAMVIAYQWQRRTGRPIDRVRADLSLWLTAGIIVGLWIIVAAVGDVAFYVLTPIVLITCGAIIAARADELQARRQINARSYAWGAIILGIAWAIAGGVALLWRNVPW